MYWELLIIMLIAIFGTIGGWITINYFKKTRENETKQKEIPMFNHDGAIENCAQDILGRKGYAKKLASAISDWAGPESIVISLNGKWGSGKTSIINCALDFIETKLSENKRPTIIKFNPWFFSGQNKLTEYFLSSISKELKLGSDKDDYQAAKDIEELIKLLSSKKTNKLLEVIHSKLLLIFSLSGFTISNFLENNIKTILLISSTAILFFEVIKELLINIKILRWKKPKTLKQIKYSIATNLSNRQNKLLIVLDDIDRLDPEETMQIFKLIKSNADFPNTIYLLAFQKDIVESKINNFSKIDGRDFLNKIIQIPFNIPKVKKEKILSFLKEELDKWIKDLPDSFDILYDKDHWIEIYHYGFKHFFNNLRDVKRFLNSYKFNLSIMINRESFEINPTDLMALETIRLFCPDFFTFMRDNKSVFLDDSGLEYALLEEKNDKSRKEIIEKHISDEFGESKDFLTNLITYMFPQLSSLLLNKHRAEDKDKWLYKLRICHEACYDAYFSLYPGGDEKGITKLEINELITFSTDIVKFRAKIEEYVKDNRINTVINMLRINLVHNESIEKSDELVFNILTVMFDISNYELIKPLESIFDDRRIRYAGIVYDLLAFSENQTSKYELIKKVMNRTNSIFACVSITANQEYQLENHEQKHGVSSPILNREQIDELKLLCIKKLSDSSIQDKLIDENYYTYIIHHWQIWSTSDDFDTYLNQIINDDLKFVNFLTKFWSNSQQEQGYEIVEKPKLNLKDLDSIIPLSEIKSKIETIESNNFELYNEEKLKIVTYKIDDYVAEKAIKKK